jgi:hypothetical protein
MDQVINLHACPHSSTTSRPGRPPSYGESLPTPEELRKDTSAPWQTFHILKNHPSTTLIRFKHMPRIKWHKAGEKRILQLVVIAPLRYTLRKNGSWQYTKPAFILSADPSIPVEQLIQAYLWRSDIEVNFRDEKQLFGVAHAQVRHPRSVASVPAVCVATYAGLLLAALRTYGFTSMPMTLTPPQWYPRKRYRRLTTTCILSQLRHELAAHSLRFINFSDFVSSPPNHPTSENLHPAKSLTKQSVAA